MTNSGDAAEQIVRMSLEGTEVALRLSGSAAKNIAVALYTVAKDSGKNQTKGQQKLNSMLKSGKELKVFTIGENDLTRFAQESKRYGVVYCVLQPKGKSPDGMVDVLVRAEDASKINRIVERFKLSAVDTVSIKHDIEKQREEREATPQQDKNDALVDDMMGLTKKREEAEQANPTAAKTVKSPPSEPISKGRESVDNLSDAADRPSVRAELQRIMAERDKGKRPVRKEERKQTKQPQTVQHRPPKKKKHKQRGR